MKIEALIVVTALAAGGVYTVQRGRTPNTMTVGGPSLDLANGTAWGVSVCPARGGVAQSIAFIVHTAAAGVGTAEVILENHTTGATMCSLQVPCATAATESVTAECAGDIQCAPGDVLHVERKGESCTAAAPVGAGSATVREL